VKYHEVRQILVRAIPSSKRLFRPCYSLFAPHKADLPTQLHSYSQQD
jgi:hypothetical protein